MEHEIKILEHPPHTKRSITPFYDVIKINITPKFLRHRPIFFKNSWLNNSLQKYTFSLSSETNINIIIISHNNQ